MDARLPAFFVWENGGPVADSQPLKVTFEECLFEFVLSAVPPIQRYSFSRAQQVLLCRYFTTKSEKPSHRETLQLAKKLGTFFWCMTKKKSN